MDDPCRDGALAMQQRRHAVKLPCIGRMKIHDYMSPVQALGQQGYFPGGIFQVRTLDVAMGVLTTQLEIYTLRE